MTDIQDLDVRIRRSSVRLEFGRNSYSGRPRLTRQLFEKLDQLKPLQESEKYGQELFKAVFKASRKLGEGYAIAQSEVRNHKVQWRVRLDIDPDAPDLHRLWWECLYDPDPPPRWLAASGTTPMSRYLEGVASDPVSASPLRILVAIANPTDLGSEAWPGLDPINEQRELKTVEDALSKLGKEVVHDVQTSPATPAAIGRRLKDDEFHVLHLICHGGFRDNQGFVLLEREDETAMPINDKALGEMVSEVESLQLVVLAACESATQSNADVFLGLAPQVLQHGVPAVVAMQGQVEIDVARAFTKHFYDALSKPRNQGMVDAAINDARKGMRLALSDQPGIWDWAKPVLFLRGDGQLFTFTADRSADAPDGRSTAQPIQDPGSRFQPGRSPDDGSTAGSARLTDPVMRKRLRLQALALKWDLTGSEVSLLASELKVDSPEGGDEAGPPMKRFRELIEILERDGCLERLPPVLSQVLALRVEGDDELDPLR